MNNHCILYENSDKYYIGDWILLCYIFSYIALKYDEMILVIPVIYNIFSESNIKSYLTIKTLDACKVIIQKYPFKLQKTVVNIVTYYNNIIIMANLI